MSAFKYNWEDIKGKSITSAIKWGNDVLLLTAVCDYQLSLPQWDVDISMELMQIANANANVHCHGDWMALPVLLLIHLQIPTPIQ